MKMTAKTLAIGAIMVLGATNVVPTHAIDDDAKVYPGAMCVRFSGAIGDNTTLSFSAIGNPSTTATLRVDCPVINDEDGDGTLQAWFRAIDQSYTADVSCSVNSFYRSGSSWLGWWTPSRPTAGAGTHVQHISFPEDLGANSVSHYYFSCRIPPRYSGHISYITSYKVEED